MRLYGSPLSPFTARVRYSLYFKDILFEQVKPSSLGGMRSPAFLAVSPLGKIPVLETPQGFRVPESDVIVEYLEDVLPERALRPAAEDARVQARLIARWADLYLVQPTLAGLGQMMPITIGRRPSPIDEQLVEAEASKLSEMLGSVDALLAAEGPFALGAEPSIADGALIPYLFFVNHAGRSLGRSDLLRADLRIGRYLDEACAADPAAARIRVELEDALASRRREVEAAFGPL
jgi:glutathione S-transferase